MSLYTKLVEIFSYTSLWDLHISFRDSDDVCERSNKSENEGRVTIAYLN